MFRLLKAQQTNSVLLGLQDQSQEPEGQQGGTSIRSDTSLRVTLPS